MDTIGYRVSRSKLRKESQTIIGNDLEVTPLLLTKAIHKKQF